MRLRAVTALIPIVLAIAGLVAASCHRRAATPPAPPAAAEAQGQPQISATLEHVRARRRLRCGVTDGLPGFAERGLTGWRGSNPMILVSSANGSSAAMSLWSATLSWVLSAIIVPELALIRTPWTSRRVGPYQRNVGKR